MKRLVLGKIYKTDDSPWLNARGYIQLLNNSYTNFIQYPENRINYITNSLGEIKNVLAEDLFIWCNEEGNIHSIFRLFLPSGKFFDFTVPVGTSPIQLSVLRENLNSSQPGYQSIVNYVDNAVEGLQLGSTQIYSNNFVATTNLSALRIVNLATGTYADASNILDIEGSLGITTNSIAQNALGKLLIFGELSDNSFNFIPNKYVYLGNVGNLTQFFENNYFQIGTAINNNKILIHFNESILCI